MMAAIQLAINTNLKPSAVSHWEARWLLFAGVMVFLIFWTVRLYWRFTLPSSPAGSGNRYVTMAGFKAMKRAREPMRRCMKPS